MSEKPTLVGISVATPHDDVADDVAVPPQAFVQAHIAVVRRPQHANETLSLRVNPDLVSVGLGATPQVNFVVAQVPSEACAIHSRSERSLRVEMPYLVLRSVTSRHIHVPVRVLVVVRHAAISCCL